MIVSISPYTVAENLPAEIVAALRLLAHKCPKCGDSLKFGGTVVWCHHVGWTN